MPAAVEPTTLPNRKVQSQVQWLRARLGPQLRERRMVGDVNEERVVSTSGEIELLDGVRCVVAPQRRKRQRQAAVTCARSDGTGVD